MHFNIFHLNEPLALLFQMTYKKFKKLTKIFIIIIHKNNPNFLFFLIDFVSSRHFVSFSNKMKNDYL